MNVESVVVANVMTTCVYVNFENSRRFENIEKIDAVESVLSVGSWVFSLNSSSSTHDVSKGISKVNNPSYFLNSKKLQPI